MTIQDLNNKLEQLRNDASRENLLDLAFGLIEWIGLDSNSNRTPQLLSPKTQKLKEFLLPAPQTVQPQLYRLNSDNQNIRVRFAVLKKLKKDYLSQLVDNDPGVESFQNTPDALKLVTKAPYFVHFVTTPEYNRLVLIFNHGDQKRIVSFRNRLTNTQYNKIVSQWHGIANKSKAEISDIFWKSLDIKEVNKEFYSQIKYSFDTLFGILKSKKISATEDQSKQFTVRLIGRYIFCWFLKEKDIISEELIGLKAIKKTKNFYQTILERLFFETLNTKVQDRDPKKHPSIFTKIPYLNGGLFDKTGEDEIFQNLDLDNWLLSFVEILESYDFTVDESSSQYQQVAVDPEMLGRIFENLLASQNDATKVLANDRKAFGAFYTPREIVDYMVSTSIRTYLDLNWEQSIIEQNTKELNNPESLGDIFGNKKPQQLKIDIKRYQIKEEDKLKIKKSLDPLFLTIPDTSHLKKEDKNLILSLLENVKIIDPACGSGAFPMGILHKLVELNEILGTVNSGYELKKEILSKNIYGVDVMPMAIEIARLRAWLSLILEEDYKSNDSKHNFNIKPLPNLDFKFVCANSLKSLGLEEVLQSDKLGLYGKYYKKLKELEEIRKQFFIPAIGNFEKQILKNQYIQERDNVVEDIKKDSDSRLKSVAVKLNDWDPFTDIQSADFFSATWMFGIGNGFDIVIGNPPYIKEFTNKSAFDGLHSSKYYQGKMDLWYLFACQLIDNLKPETGILTFIATNNWVTNAGASKFRNKIASDAQIVQLIDFGNFKIFESADIQTMIMLFKASDSNEEYHFDYRRIIDTQVTLDDAIEVLNKINSSKNQILEPVFDRTYLKDKSFLFSGDGIEEILNIILDSSNFKLDEDTEIATGIDVHQDFVNKASLKVLGPGYHLGEGIFNLSTKEKTELSFSQDELKFVKPFFTTEELSRYYGDKNNKLWVIYTDSSFKNPKNIQPYPVIKNHLDRFEKIITSDNAPYGLHRARNENFFKGEKIISLRKCALPTFTYTDFDCYVSQTFFVIKTNRINQKFLTALLNSKLIAFWLKHRGKMQGFQYQVDKGPLIELPLVTTTDTKVFENLVDYILFINENPSLKINEYVPNEHLIRSFEEVINACVYELYFKNHMEEKKINILNEAINLIKPIGLTNNEDLKSKASIINQVYSQLKDVNNEVRNRMSLFSTRSENVILPIQKVY